MKPTVITKEDQLHVYYYEAILQELKGIREALEGKPAPKPKKAKEGSNA